MTKKIAIIAAIMLVFSLGGWGCAEKAAEKTAEKAIEGASGGAVDVDIDDESITITDQNTNTTATYGQNELPDAWPSDIEIYDGEIIHTQSTSDEDSALVSATVTSDKSLDSVYDYYQNNLPDAGWTVSSTLTTEEIKTLTAEKGNQVLSLLATTGDETASTYTITITTEQE